MFHVQVERAASDVARRRRLLIADAESYFCDKLAKASSERGMETILASGIEDAIPIIENECPDYVVVDQHVPTDGAIEILQLVKRANRKAKCVVVTRYPSLACAVKAIKQGAWNYLAKPISAEMVLDSFADDFDDNEAANKACAQPMSVNRLEWEHIHSVLTEYNDNISATARALGMHRRTLQRKLSKYPSLR